MTTSSRTDATKTAASKLSGNRAEMVRGSCDGARYADSVRHAAIDRNAPWRAVFSSAAVR